MFCAVLFGCSVNLIFHIYPGDLVSKAVNVTHIVDEILLYFGNPLLLCCVCVGGEGDIHWGGKQCVVCLINPPVGAG